MVLESIRSAPFRRRWGYESTDGTPRRVTFRATGNVDVITLDHIRAMHDRAIVCAASTTSWRSGRAAQLVEQRQAAGRRRSSSRTAKRSSFCRRGAWSISAMRWAIRVRDVGLVHRPDAGANRALRKPGQCQRSIRCQSTWTRRSPAASGRNQVSYKMAPKQSSALAQANPFKPETYRYWKREQRRGGAFKPAIRRVITLSCPRKRAFRL